MRIVTAARWVNRHIVELNLFESTAAHSHLFHLRTAIISTRVYLILLTIAVTSLIGFYVLDDQIGTITIQSPSEAIFEELYSNYSTTLQCPCSGIDIPYKTFLNISYKLHPVCSSVFISDTWINLLFSPQIGYYYPIDFRSSASGQFQLLSSLCSFANRTIEDAIDDLLSDTFLSPQVVSNSSLNAQSQAQSQFIQNSTTNAFRQLIDLVRGSTQMNSLQPALQTSKMHLVEFYSDGSWDAYPLETIWAVSGKVECFCSVTLNCSLQSGFFNIFAYESEGYFPRSIRPRTNVTGFVAGCFALESLLQSTLECFFDQKCLNTTLKYFPFYNTTNFTVLDLTQTQYTYKTTIETLANNLFIESWSSESLFSAYYLQCAPISCTYKITQPNNILNILTTLLGLYGGLTIALRFCVFVPINWWRNRQINRRVNHSLVIRRIERLRSIWRWIKVHMSELNLFKSAATRTSPIEMKTAKIATRLYLLLMILSMAVITIYTLSSLRIQIVTIQNPSRMVFEQLHDEYSSTITCPCTNIAISYKLFTSLSPKFHPVCSSLFVSNAWIVSTSALNTVNSDYDILDFRSSGPTFFNALAALCSLSQITVADNWYIFSQTPLITDHALSESEFEARTKATIEQFEKNMIIEFKYRLALIEAHTLSLYATGYEDILLYTNQSSNSTKPIDFGWIPSSSDTCSCGLDENCHDLMCFYNYTDNTVANPYYLTYTLPNIIVGCFVIPSVYESSLECFFNQTCLDLVQIEIQSSQSINVSILQTNSTRYSPQTVIETLVNNLMVDTWNEIIQYDEYYDQCAPEQCTYTFTSRKNLLQVITTTVGLFGGLSVGLRVIVLLFAFCIRRIMHSTEEENNMTGRPAFFIRVHVGWNWLKTKILKFNIFESELSWDDHSRRQIEIIGTRLYVLLLSLAITILIIYNSVSIQSQLVTISSPSEIQFDQLRLNPQYSSTLECPCQNITISYNSFTSITPHYHQLCSSDFVMMNNIWISLMYSPLTGVEYVYDDFRLFAVPQFRLLAALCTLANETVSEAIALFSTSSLVSERVQYRETIQSKANASFNQLRSSIPRTFVRTLDFIRNIAQGNGIVSSILSNWHFLTMNTTFKSHTQWPALWPEPRSYGDNNCSCGTNATCTSQAAFDGSIVPGFRVGCYPLEALLQSTLECLYNVSCIDILRFMYGSSNVTFNPLFSNLSSLNATVQSLVDALLVDQWETSVTYEQYYAACAPLSCTYIANKQPNALYMAAIIISLYGGLTTALKLLVPLFVKIGYNLMMHRQQRVEPSVIVLAAQH